VDRKTKVVSIIALVIIACSFVTYSTEALITANINVSTSGIVQSPSPTPTAASTPAPNNPASNNLAPFPSAWGDYSSGYGIIFTSVLPPSANQITAYDSNVYHTAGQGSTRLDPYVTGSENTAREIDANWISVSPGEKITFSCWIKVQTTSSSLFYPQCGGRIGIDFYGSNGRIQGKQSAGQTFYPNEDNNAIIADWVCNANDGTWQLRTMSFTLPSTLTCDRDSSQQVPIGIIAWMQAGPPFGSTQSSVWFADPQIYFS